MLTTKSQGISPSYSDKPYSMAPTSMVSPSQNNSCLSKSYYVLGIRVVTPSVETDISTLESIKDKKTNCNNKKRLENIEAFLFGTLDYNYEIGRFDLTPPSEFAPKFE